MSIAAVEHVRQITGLKITEKFVLTTIAHYLNSKSNVAWPSIPTIAADCSMSERTVSRALASLEQKELIKRLHGLHGINNHNGYQIPGFDSETVRSSPHDRVSPCQSVTPDRNDKPPLTETTATPDRNDSAYKEERELKHRERTGTETRALSLNQPSNSLAPAFPQIPIGPQGFDYNAYLVNLAQRGKLSRNQERQLVNDLVMEEDRKRAMTEPKRDYMAEARACYGL